MWTPHLPTGAPHTHTASGFPQPHLFLESSVGVAHFHPGGMFQINTILTQFCHIRGEALRSRGQVSDMSDPQVSVAQTDCHLISNDKTNDQNSQHSFHVCQHEFSRITAGVEHKQQFHPNLQIRMKTISLNIFM